MFKKELGCCNDVMITGFNADGKTTQQLHLMVISFVYNCVLIYGKLPLVVWKL